MEKISAACAMEWSIELEKSLRSKTHSRSVEAILKTGPRLQRWSTEPEPTLAVCNMFGLVPGEDRLFANAILLRLADAFRFGDRETRISVVRVFLMEFRNRKKNKKRKLYNGLLSKSRVHNQLELLGRVKVVYDVGDVELRVFALILFGCWADFAKDSAHIRYLVLSSMVSADVLEVKASLFAAGCFCELADDFACVVLEMLLNIVTSSETLLSVRLAGARVFAKMGCSYSIANRAYKTGIKLILDSLEEDFLVAMLVSLSKLAYRSAPLLSEQVNLLLSFLSQEKTLRLQATALKCLHFIFVRQGCHIPVDMHVIKTLFTILDATEIPSTMQCEALQILHKMLLYHLANLPHDDMLKFEQLLATFENSIRSPTMSKSLLAVRVLADLSKKLKGRTGMAFAGESGDFSYPLPTWIISIILDWFFLLVKPLFDQQQADARIFQKVQNLLSHLLFLVREHPDLGVVVLDKTRLFIEHVMDMHNKAMGKRQAGQSVLEIVDGGSEKGIGSSLKLVYIIHRFFVICVDNLKEIGALSTEIFDKVQLLVECVHRCRIFDCYAHLIYSMLLHSHFIWGLASMNKETSNRAIDLDSSLHKPLVEHEIFSLGCAEKMLTERDNWPAYKAGKFAVCQGAWVTAVFIFDQLISRVQQKSSSGWLKTLAQFCQSECKIQLFLLPKIGSSLVDWSHGMLSGNDIDKILQGVITDIHNPNSTEVLLGAYNGLCSSWKTMESIGESGKLFCFQRWFLALRAKVLGNVVDILKILDNIPCRQESIDNNGQVKKSVTVEWLNSLQRLAQVPFQLKRLAEEFDLIVMSFIGMDSSSSKTISALALSCSLLALTAGFTISIPNMLSDELLNCNLESSSNCFQGMVTDLVERLCLIDEEICSNFCLLLENGKQPKYYSHLQHRNQILNIGGEMRDILSVCRYAVSGITGLQNEAKKKEQEILSQVTIGGLQLLSNTISKWLHIPFRVPKFFFKVRPCIGSELYAFCADTRNQYDLSVLPGFHLSLNLCLQLRNIPPGLPIQMTKFYCILYSSTAFQESRQSGETKGPMQLDYQAWETDNMVQMNEKLMCYVSRSTMKTKKGKRGRDEEDNNDDGIVNTFVCFELNEMGQGFSNCLLDVSGFPVGSYRIKWHSCCIDSRGCYWSLLPLNAQPIFNVQLSSAVG